MDRLFGPPYGIVQASFTYQSERLADSLRYAQLGAEIAAHSRGTAAVWLASGEARALAALNRLEEAHTALGLSRQTGGR